MSCEVSSCLGFPRDALRERASPSRRKTCVVVVGVSATSKSPKALTWGAAQAAQNNGRLVAVRSWRVTGPPGTTSGGAAARVTDERDTERSEQAALEADVAEALGPDHGAQVRAVRGGKRKVLLAAAKDADLLVVDAPRTFTGAPRFAQRLVYAAACPVVVMPPSGTADPPGVLTRAGRAVGVLRWGPPDWRAARATARRWSATALQARPPHRRRRVTSRRCGGRAGGLWGVRVAGPVQPRHAVGTVAEVLLPGRPPWQPAPPSWCFHLGHI